jgi:hypothetical protein
VPPVADDPFARPRGARGLGDARHDLVPRARRGEIELLLHLAEPREVPVSLDEAGNRQPPSEVDHARRRRDEPAHLCRGAHREDAIARDRHRLGFRVRRVDGDDVAVDQGERGALRLGSVGNRDQRRGDHPAAAQHRVDRRHG